MKWTLFSRFLALFSFLIITSCATVNNAPPPQNQNTPWDTRVQALSKIHQWDVKGLISFRAGNQANTANLDWRQTGQTYTMSLFGPLGSNSYRLTGRPGKVELAGPNGQHFYAKSPEEILAKQTGWRLPVSNIYYWIRGLPVPGLPDKKEFDPYHHLTLLQQNGWTIQYLRYTTAKNIDLPNKIFINSRDLNVKIIVNSWQI